VKRFLQNYLSTLAFIGISWWIITYLSPFHRNELQAQWQFGSEAALHVRHLFLALIALYVAVLVPYYLRYPWLHSKAWVLLHGLYFSALRLARPMSRARRAQSERNRWRLPLKANLSPGAKQAGLSVLLKFFFAPLMINWCLNHFAALGGSLAQLFDYMKAGVSGLQLFDNALFWACFQLILFVDTLLFTLGYIVEIPALRNRIRSVDRTFFGWFVCLICYPPFNQFTSQVLPWQSSDFPQFSTLPGDLSQGAKEDLHVLANGLLLASLAVFSWASVALGFKASNLTNRGIVAHGPYSVVRHPAYAAKNLAWWIGAIPAIYFAFLTGGASQGVPAVLFTLGWTGIYVLRAITEERHLLMIDNGYAQYMARVRWRFIPGVV
jgi:protein-S-isoprenylcysteine O-methyltransferase Ste14